MEASEEGVSTEGIRDIVRWLTTPAASGVYLTARDLRRIGNAAGVTGLPANRRVALEQLFRAAALDSTLDDLFDLLLAEVDEHRRSYVECDEHFLSDWIVRSSETSRMLESMRRIWVDQSAR